MSTKFLLAVLLLLSTFSGYSQDTIPKPSTDTIPERRDTTLNRDTMIAVVDSTDVLAPVQFNRSSDRVYKLNPAVDIPVTAIPLGWSLYAFTKIYSKDPSTEAQILALNKEDINSFDRWGADVYSEKAATSSDFFFYGAMPLPLVLMLDKQIRKDALKVGFLYLQAMSITGLLYTGSVYFVDKYRPLAYNPEVPMADRRAGGSKNSFFAGHVALVGTSSFFVAKVFSDYHPNSKLKPLFYGIAIVSTAGTGYLRHRGGKHFPSDILIGTAVGTLSGLLVPKFHKNKDLQNNRLTLLPNFSNTPGISMIYKLK